MKVILEYFVGFVIVIYDIIKHLYIYLRDSLLILFSTNRKNNVIYYRLTHKLFYWLGYFIWYFYVLCSIFYYISNNHNRMVYVLVF